MNSAGPEVERAAAGAGAGGSVARSAGILTMAGTAVGLSNLLFHVIVAREGGAESYGAIGALLTMTSVATYLATGTNYAVARSAATSGLPTRTILSRAVLGIWPAALVTVALLVAALPLAGYLHLSGPLPVVIVAVLFSAIVANAVPLGVLVGLQRFAFVAGLQLAAAAIRLVAGAVLGGSKDPIVGALAATGTPVLVVAPVAVLLALRSRPVPAPVTGDEVAASEVGGEAIRGALLAAALWALWSLPAVYARHDFSAVESGNFAAAQLLTGGILFLTAPLTLVFYARAARGQQPTLVRRGFAATMGLAIAAGIGATVLGPPVVNVVYRGHFGVSASLFAALSASALVVSAGTYAMWISRALRRNSLVVMGAIVLSLGIEAVAGAFWHAGPIFVGLEPALAGAAGSGLALATMALMRTRRATV